MVRPSFLVVGGGSIGERHLRCLRLAGFKNIALVEPRASRLRELSKLYPGIKTFTMLENALKSRFTHAVVATPPAQHYAHTRKLISNGLHVLVEKPLCASAAEAQAFARLACSTKKTIRVAFNFRSSRILREAKKMIKQGKVGRLKIFQIITGQHFPQFRPDYQKIYWADPKQGGCCLDGVTHLVDLAMWYLGSLKWVGGSASNLGIKNVRVDDSAALVLKGKKGEQVMLAVNQFQAPNEGRYSWIGDKGCLKVDSPAGILASFASGAKSWKSKSIVAQRDDAYIRQLKQFVKETSGAPRELCTVPEAAENLKLCLKLRKTHKQGSS